MQFNVVHISETDSTNRWLKDSRGRHEIPLCVVTEYQTAGRGCSPLMWAHYANSHKGICIQYKINPSLIQESDQWVIRLMDVDYKKVFPLDGNIPLVDSLCVKSGSWQYENETRLILYTRDKANDYGRRRMKSHNIEAVYMGYRIEHEKRNFLKNMLLGTNIKLYQMSFDDNDISTLVAHLVNL